MDDDKLALHDPFRRQREIGIRDRFMPMQSSIFLAEKAVAELVVPVVPVVLAEKEAQVAGAVERHISTFMIFMTLAIVTLVMVA